MKIGKLSLSISLLLMVLFTWVGCSSDLAEYDKNSSLNNNNDSETYLTFDVSLPSITTRSAAGEGTETSASEDPETSIKSVDILVFEESQDNEYLSYITEAQVVSSASTDFQSFEAKLKQSTNSEKYRVVVIANAHAAVVQAKESLAEGQLITKNGFLSLVKFHQAAKPWPIKENGLPMWGESKSTHLITQNTKGGEFGTIQMLRAMARIDVSSALSPDDFKIEKVVVRNINKTSLVAPTFIYNDELGEFVQQKPSLVNILNPGEESIIDRVEYDIAAGSNQLSGEVYVGEAKNQGQGQFNRLCLLIAGKYKSSAQTTWYRVDFETTSSAGPVIFTDILRNHLYNIQINTVSNAGADNEDAAYNTVKSDMTVTINDWNLYELGDIIFDGNHFLSINPSKVEHDREPVLNDTIFISTDVFEGSGSVPTYEVFDYQNTNKVEIDNPNYQWIKDVKVEKVDGIPNTYALVYSLTENNESKLREAYFRISANDRLTVALNLRQVSTIKPEISITQEIDGQDVEVNSIYFVDEYGAQGTAEFKIKYKPANAALKVVAVRQDRTIDWASKPPLGVIEHKNGLVTALVEPYPISYGAANNGDFDEHTYKIVAFLETDEGVVSKSLSFVQAKPGVYLEAPETVYLDGNINYGIKVKATIPWSLNLTRNEAGKLGYGNTDDILDPFAPAFSIGETFIGLHPIRESDSATKHMLIQHGEPNLHKKGEVLPLTPVDDINSKELKSVFTGYIDLQLSGYTPSSFIKDCNKNIFLTTGVDQTYREANCYVLNPNSQMGIMIPIRSDMMMVDEFIDGNNILYKNSNYEVPTITSNLFPKLVWTDVKQRTVGRKGVHADIIQPSIVYSDEDFIRFIGIVDHDSQKYLLVVPGEDAINQGNAVIAVTDGDGGTILRSWHIWITDIPYDGEYLNGQLQSGYNGSGTGSWLDRDLGATSGKKPLLNSDAYKSIGLYYQFGRKDPFPKLNELFSSMPTSPTAYYVPTEPTKKVIASDPLDEEMNLATVQYDLSNSNVSLEKSFNKPLTIYFKSNRWDTSGSSRDYWYTDPVAKRYKSVFDPCPAGYRVPSQNTSELYSLSSDDWNVDVFVGSVFKGRMDVYGNFFPITGQLVASKSGLLTESMELKDTQQGFRWGSDLTFPGDKTKGGYTFMFDSGPKVQRIQDPKLSSAKPVRCVKVDSAK